MRQRRLSFIDRLIGEADTVLRTLSDRGGHSAARPSPAEGHQDAELSEEERQQRIEQRKGKHPMRPHRGHDGQEAESEANE